MDEASIPMEGLIGFGGCLGRECPFTHCYVLARIVLILSVCPASCRVRIYSLSRLLSCCLIFAIMEAVLYSPGTKLPPSFYAHTPGLNEYDARFPYLCDHLSQYMIVERSLRHPDRSWPIVIGEEFQLNWNGWWLKGRVSSPICVLQGVGVLLPFRVERYDPHRTMGIVVESWECIQDWECHSPSVESLARISGESSIISVL